MSEKEKIEVMQKTILDLVSSQNKINSNIKNYEKSLFTTKNEESIRKIKTAIEINKEQSIFNQNNIDLLMSFILSNYLIQSYEKDDKIFIKYYKINTDMMFALFAYEKDNNNYKNNPLYNSESINKTTFDFIVGTLMLLDNSPQNKKRILL